MTSPRNPDLTAKFEEERLRAQEQSQLMYLQGQIDDLRRQIKEQTNKYNLVTEQVRKVEAMVTQAQSLYEQHTEEVNRSVESVRRDVATLRKEIAGAMVKVDEAGRPLREMQAQIQQVAEARKQDRDFVSGWFGRIEATEQKILSLQAQIKETDERQRQLALQLDRLREADQVAINEARKVGEEFQIERQNLRRQAVEAQQLVSELYPILDDHKARLQRLDDIRKQIDIFAETLPAQYAELASKLPEISVELKRIERIATERFLMNQERMEEIRQQSDDKIESLRETDEQHLRQLTSWLERIDALLREFEHRLSRSTSRIENLQTDHFARLVEIENREMATIRALAEAFRERSEAVRAAQIEARGDDK